MPYATVVGDAPAQIPGTNTNNGYKAPTPLDKAWHPTTCLKPMPAMVPTATAKLHIPQPKLINRTAQVLLPQPMVFCGTPMVIDAWPKETGGKVIISVSQRYSCW